MTAELPKTYDPSAVEAAAYRSWIDQGLFTADPSAPGEPYCIVIPPPNVTGALHLGHAINNTLQDILIRNHRMRGFNTLWIPGIDHAGIATQAVVEKQLKEKENKTRHDVGREGLVERIWEWKQQYGDRILEQLKRLGCSCDWTRTRFTLDDTLAKAVRETFFKLFKDGLIYRGKRLVNWDVHLQTSISDDEIYHEKVKTFLWHIRYPIVLDESDEATERRSDEGKGEENTADAPSAHDPSSPSSLRRFVASSLPTHMTVATTRPETMLGDTAVAVHSEDPRWNWAIGKFVELPLTGRRIPIIADDILVDPTFGSGVVKVTPAHDPNDYAVWQRHQGKPDEIDLINILNPDGTLNENAGAYKGMKRDAARKKVVEDLEAQGLIAKIDPYETEVGHSDRSKTAVEPYLSDQWFVKMAPLAEPALDVVRDGTIKFFPERHAQQYLAWLGEKRDWPISRQLWWGHRIPVWRNPDGLESGYRKTFGTSPDGPPVADHLQNLRVLAEAGRIAIDATTEFVCVRDDDDLEVKMELQDWGWEQDPDVLDTWFSSALWPHSTLGWPEESPDLRRYYPTSALLTGRDIITLWVARMVMTGIYNMKEIPFRHVVINPTILDEFGRRMSKSAGNGVDPVDIIDTHGADALRFTLTTMATETQDARMPVKILCPKCQTLIPNPESNKIITVTCPSCKTTVTRPVGTLTGSPEAPLGRMTSDKFDLGRNFCNKLWNAARFALSNLEMIPQEAVDESKWTLADRWIVSRLNRTIEECNASLAIYRFDQYAKACYDFFWRDLCDWYVEAIKPALKDAKSGAQSANVLAATLDATLRLMHPIIPFITETIWWKLDEVRPVRDLPGRVACAPNKNLITAAWPSVGNFSEAAEFIFPKLQEIIVAIRNARNEYKVDVKQIVDVSILAPGDSARQIEANRAMIELLAGCRVKAISATLAPIASAARASAAGCDIFIEGLVDENAEKERSTKRREELTKKISTLKSRLANTGYIAKAPPALVKQTQDELAEAEAELVKLESEKSA